MTRLYFAPVLFRHLLLPLSSECKTVVSPLVMRWRFHSLAPSHQNDLSDLLSIPGNYYSLRSQHEKAILYFQRALKLNPNYLSAWTLVGHEFVEVKNTAAAIKAYRQAIGKLRRGNGIYNNRSTVIGKPTYGGLSSNLLKLSWTSMSSVWERLLTHWGRDKMAAISQTTFSSAFSWMKTF